MLTFLRQTLSDFRATGAIAPSSRFLANAMTRALPSPDAVPADYHALEVGSGTGAISQAIAARLALRGRLDLCEIAAPFAAHLRKRLETDQVFCAMRGRICLHETDVRRLPAQATYHAILSALPLNNFDIEEVRSIYQHFFKMLCPGGTLTWYEYVGVRSVQMPFVSRSRRARLKGVAGLVADYVRLHPVRVEYVALNLPPAFVRTLRFSVASG
jgi:phospholipid N-methyltransferase